MHSTSLWILLLLTVTPTLAVQTTPIARKIVPGQNIAVVYTGEAADAGFNQLILQGVRDFEAQRRIKVSIYTHALGRTFRGSELEQQLTEAILNGVDAVVVAGALAYEELMRNLSARYPALRLVAIDGAKSNAANTQTVLFRSNEAAYLAGIVAARSSRSGTLGFVGGLDASVIRAFGCAYAQGARAARADVKVLGRMIGDRATAFSDPAGGARMARELIRSGADVVFAAAGGSGLGTLKEVANAGIYGIGVDDNQNGLYPGRILTSVIKRIDVSIYSTLVQLHDGVWQPGTQSVGLSEGAVGLAMDEHNRGLIDRATRAELEVAEFAIRSGELEVINAELDDAPCAALIEYPAKVASTP